MKEMPIFITAQALAELNKLQEEGKPYLRVGVKSGGCSGLSYVIEWAEQPNVQDRQYPLSRFTLLIDVAHLAYLDQITLHFEQGLNARGFVFENPNAKEKCGCGSSFAV